MNPTAIELQSIKMSAASAETIPVSDTAVEAVVVPVPQSSPQVNTSKVCKDDIAFLGARN